MFSRNPDGDWVWSSDSDDGDSDDDDSNSAEPQNASAAPNAEPLKKIEEVHTAKKKLERLQFSTSSSFFKIWSAVVVNLKHIFELFWLYTTCFLI